MSVGEKMPVSVKALLRGMARASIGKKGRLLSAMYSKYLGVGMSGLGRGALPSHV